MCRFILKKDGSFFSDEFVQCEAVRQVGDTSGFPGDYNCFKSYNQFRESYWLVEKGIVIASSIEDVHPIWAALECRIRTRLANERGEGYAG